MAQTRHAGTWTIEERCESAWQYLTFDVPPGSSALRVELDYDATAAVLDLGCFGPAGFRGWSGGARRSFVIGARSATPGYLPGDLEPGPWQVVLGLHRIPAAGIGYTLTADVTSQPGQLDRADDTAAAAARGLALELARPALDDAAGMVARLASGRDRGRRQRLAPARLRRTARLAHDVGAERE